MNNNYKSTIENLWAEALASPYKNETNTTEKILDSKCAITKAIILSYTDNDKKVEVEDSIGEIAYEYSKEFYKAGFLRAMNIILDCLTGGVSV